MNLYSTHLDGLTLIKLTKNVDERGSFTRYLCRRTMKDYGLDFDSAQINHAHSKVQGTFRGLHMQLGEASETKIVIVETGKIQDIVIDLRKNSESFQEIFSINLDQTSFQGIIIPRGFAHGYLTLSQDVNLLYLVDNYYSPAREISINPHQERILNLLEGEIELISQKDKTGLSLDEVLTLI